MKKIKSYFKKSNKGAMIIISVLLLFLYGFTISTFLAKSPSHGFSREVEIARVTSAKTININSHVQTMKISDNQVLIAAVDGHKYKLIYVSELGQVIKEEVLDLDFYNAIKISASIDNDGNLSLYYLDEDLYSVTIDLETLKYETSKIADEVDKFIRQGNVVVYQEDSALYGFSVKDSKKVFPISKGPIKSFALDQDEDTDLYHLVMTIRNTLAVDIHYVQLNDAIVIEKDFVIAKDITSKYLQYISAVHAEGDDLTAIYVWSDSNYGKNNVTVHQYDIKSGEKVTDYYDKFSFHRSKYFISDVEGDQVKVLFQEDIDYVVNIVEALLSSDKETVISPLTKTKKLSLLSNYLKLGDDEALVFFDLSDGEKIIYFASSNEDLVDSTSKASSINPIRIIFLFLMIMVQAAFTSGVGYLVPVSIIPLLLLLLMKKFLPKYKNKLYIESGIAALIHTALKLYLTYSLIHVLGRYVLRPLIIGNEPFIYVIMLLLSIVSYFLMLRHIKWHLKEDTKPIPSFMYFIFFEYIVYTLLVYIYETTIFVIEKI